MPSSQDLILNILLRHNRESFIDPLLFDSGVLQSMKKLPKSLNQQGVMQV